MSDKKLEESILRELNLTHESLDDGVTHIIDWISKQPHLPNLTDKETIKAFIVGSKSIERAKEKIDKYYSVKAKYPVYFANRDPNNIEWPSIEKMVRLPGLTPEGYVAYLIIPPTQQEEVDLFDYVLTIKVFFMMLDRLYHSDPIIAGHYLIFDCKDLSLEFVLKCFSVYLPASYNIYQGSLPLRLKGIISFNASTAAEYMAEKIFRFLLNDKLRQRVYVHSEDHTVLSKYIPLDMLPSDYGGKSPSVKQLLDKEKKDLEQDRDWFLNEGNEICDESKRPKPESSTENVQGTFRKLTVE